MTLIRIGNEDMRHKISGRKLNRKTSHRIALLKNLAKSSYFK